MTLSQIDNQLNTQRRILIVDDQTFNIEALKIILEHSVGIPNAQSIIDWSLNGKEAVKAIERNIEANCGMGCSYDLILMDCNMPVMDGYTASLKIREMIHELGLEQPIISAVTGHTE